MALFLSDCFEKENMLHATFGVVAFSIIVQGLTIGRIFKADQMKRLLKGG